MSDSVDPLEHRLAALTPLQRDALHARLKAALGPKPSRAISARRQRHATVLSAAQRRLWFLEQLRPGTPDYVVPVALRLRGDIDARALARALSYVVQRHEILRTTYHARDEAPVQIPTDSATIDIPVVDLRQFAQDERGRRALQIARADALRPFDLEAGPILRCQLVRTQDDEHVLLLALHHIACDGWSMPLLFKEWAGAYEAIRGGREPAGADLAVQYADFAEWEQQSEKAAEAAERAEAWAHRLQGVPTLILPTGGAGSSDGIADGACDAVCVSAETVDALRALARNHGATLAAVMFAAFTSTLAEVAGQHRFIVGAGLANRVRPELEPLIGFFVNTLPVPVDLRDCADLPGRIELAHRILLEAQDHQDAPLDLIVRRLRPDRTAGRNPLFNVGFFMQPGDGSAPQFAGTTVEPFLDMTTTRLDLECHVRVEKSSLVCTFYFDRELLDAERVRTWLVALKRLLECQRTSTTDAWSRGSSATGGPVHPTARAHAAECGVSLRQSLDAPKALALPSAIHAATRGDVQALPLSCAQERMWLLHELEPHNPAYNMTVAVEIGRPIPGQVLKHAVEFLLQRHEVLRTVYADDDGQVRQVVGPNSSYEFCHEDLVGLTDAEAHDAIHSCRTHLGRKPFDLRLGPLLRVALLSCSSTRSIVLLATHQIAIDELSTEILSRDLREALDAAEEERSPQLPALPIQYADYAAWQRAYLQGELLDNLIRFWRDRLSGVASPPLALDFVRPRDRGYARDSVSRELAPELVTQIQNFARRERLTLFMVALAAFKVLLRRYTGESDVAVCVPVAGRDRAELRDLVGFFGNTLVMRTDLSGAATFGDVVWAVRRTVLEAFDHQDLPFERLVAAISPQRDLSRNPLVQVLFGLSTTRLSNLGLGAQGSTKGGLDQGSARFDLEATFAATTDDMQIRLQYDVALFDRSTVERMAEHYVALLGCLVRAPGEPVARLPMLAPDERSNLLRQWNATARPYSPPHVLHELIARQCERTPDAPAVRGAAARLTYRELDERASRVARWLLKRVDRESRRVGVLMDRSTDLVVTLLGVLKAGCAYVPLDPALPPTRLEVMIEDAAVQLIVGDQPVLLPAQGLRGARLVTLAEIDADSEESTTAPIPRCDPADVAYVIFTSGSTGRPKGVMNSHAGVCNRLLWMQEQYELRPGDRVLQKTPFGFDVSVWEFFWPLIVGAELYVAVPGGHQDPVYLARTIKAEGITVLHFVPSMLREFLAEPEVRGSCGTLRHVFCSGEALAPDLPTTFFEVCNARLHNLYGPTEAAIDVSYFECQPGGSWPSVPIGRPVANTTLYVLDEAMEPVPRGVVGDLYIGGVQVALGYAGRADLTRERFVEDTLGPGNGRLYRTGDRARYLLDGNLEYHGRDDQQVKIRGNRVECGEIEAVLSSHAGIAAVAVVAVDRSPRETELVAYVVNRNRDGGASAGPTPTIDELRALVRSRLPEYMVPSAFIALKSIPKTTNGKLDRRALPEPTRDARPSDRQIVAPRTETERAILDIWRFVLGVDRIGIDENFFDLGGHSLMATRVVVRVRTALGIDVPLRVLFKEPTIRALAQFVELSQRGATGGRSAEPLMKRIASMSGEERSHLLALARRAKGAGT